MHKLLYYHSCRSLNQGAWELGNSKNKSFGATGFFFGTTLAVHYKEIILGNFALTTFLHRHIEKGDTRPLIRSDFGPPLADDRRRGKLVADHPWWWGLHPDLRENEREGKTQRPVDNSKS
jgi:hypothetical protein